MWQRAEQNRSRLDREVRLRFDGKHIEFWSYVTDYARKVDSTITFIDGRVTEIRATSWRKAD